MIEASVTVIEKQELGRADMIGVFAAMDETGKVVESRTTKVLKLKTGETGKWSPFELEIPAGGSMMVTVTDRDWAKGQAIALKAAEWVNENGGALAKLVPGGAAAIPVVKTGLEKLGEALADDPMGSWVVSPPTTPDAEIHLEPEHEEGPRAKVVLRWLADPDASA